MENNRLIAEFMGLRTNSYGDYNIDKDVMGFDMIVCSLADTKFHTSWDWLMPVVEKIEDIECKETSTDLVGYHLYDVEIRQNVTTIHGTNIEETAGGKLFNTYNAVVEFIKKYNDEQ